MNSPLAGLSEARRADLLLAASLSALFGLSFFLCSLPTWFALVIGPIAGTWSVLVLHGARRAHAAEASPLPPFTIAAARRIILLAVALWLIVAGLALAYWYSQQ